MREETVSNMDDSQNVTIATVGQVELQASEGVGVF